jgi:hypothetical protein
MVEGLELFAMAEAIPRLQNFGGVYFKPCLDLHYFTCHQANAVDLSSQRTSFTEVGPRGPQVPYPCTLILQKHRCGALSRVYRAVQIPHAWTIDACFRFL